MPVPLQLFCRTVVVALATVSMSIAVAFLTADLKGALGVAEPMNTDIGLVNAVSNATTARTTNASTTMPPPNSDKNIVDPLYRLGIAKAAWDAIVQLITVIFSLKGLCHGSFLKKWDPKELQSLKSELKGLMDPRLEDGGAIKPSRLEDEKIVPFAESRTLMAQCKQLKENLESNELGPREFVAPKASVEDPLQELEKAYVREFLGEGLNSGRFV